MLGAFGQRIPLALRPEYLTDKSWKSQMVSRIFIVTKVNFSYVHNTVIPIEIWRFQHSNSLDEKEKERKKKKRQKKVLIAFVCVQTFSLSSFFLLYMSKQANIYYCKAVEHVFLCVQLLLLLFISTGDCGARESKNGKHVVLSNDKKVFVHVLISSCSLSVSYIFPSFFLSSSFSSLL